MLSAQADINTTPLIDVLLVLLVMLILTIPVATHKVAMDLPVAPQASSRAVGPVYVDIDPDGRVYMNNQAVPNMVGLETQFRSLMQSSTDTEIRVEPSRLTRYEPVAQVLAAANRARVEKLQLKPIKD